MSDNEKHMAERTLITHAEAEHIAERAAKLAVADTFSLLGLDITSEESRSNFRKNNEFSQRQREASEEASRMMRVTVWKIIPVLTVGLLGWLAVVFSEGLRTVIADWLVGGPK